MFPASFVQAAPLKTQGSMDAAENQYTCPWRFVHLLRDGSLKPFATKVNVFPSVRQVSAAQVCSGSKIVNDRRATRRARSFDIFLASGGGICR